MNFFRLRTEIARLKTNLEPRGKLSRKLKTIFKSKRKGSRILRMEIQNDETGEYFDTELHELPMIRRLVKNVAPPWLEIFWKYIWGSGVNFF